VSPPEAMGLAQDRPSPENQIASTQPDGSSLSEVCGAFVVVVETRDKLAAGGTT